MVDQIVDQLYARDKHSPHHPEAYQVDLPIPILPQPTNVVMYELEIVDPQPVPVLNANATTDPDLTSLIQIMTQKICIIGFQLAEVQAAGSNRYIDRRHRRGCNSNSYGGQGHKSSDRINLRCSSSGKYYWTHGNCTHTISKREAMALDHNTDTTFMAMQGNISCNNS